MARLARYLMLAGLPTVGCVLLDDSDLEERLDQDGDGVARPLDCDDEDPAITVFTFHADADGDDFGSTVTTTACTAPDGFVAQDGDCDDADPTVFPGAVEYCDGVDNDCTNGTDEPTAVDAQTWYPDADADGYGDPLSPITACTQPADSLTDATDCDDSDATVHPGAREVCDGDAPDALDHDCDGDPDEAPPWYLDADLDGFGDATTMTQVCPAPDWHISDGSDCDDTDPDISPSASERCDDEGLIDEDCDGLVDDDDDAVQGRATWYPDEDGDGFGSATGPTLGCVAPDGFVADATDCDDSSEVAYPGADEVWYDGADQDCSGEGDSDFDADADGFDSDVYGGEDCDDAVAVVNPDAMEACSDDVDNDCDGVLAGQCALSGTFDLGDAAGRILGDGGPSGLGNVVANAGDVDGDGANDVLVAAWSGYGTNSLAWLLSGPVTGDVGVEDAVATIDVASSRYGMDLHGPVDLDGDGYDDVLVAVDDGYGDIRAYLYTGPVTGDLDADDADLHLHCESDRAASVSGFATHAQVTLGGDLAGLGSPTLVVSDPGGGVVWLAASDLVGAVSLETDALAWVYHEDSSDQIGSSLAGDGDLDGDGIADLLLGAPLESQTHGSYEGSVYLLNGPVTDTIELADADARLHGPTGNNFLGSTVAYLGDADGDGLDDFMVSAANYGEVYILFDTPVGTAELDSGDVTLNGGDLGFTGWSPDTVATVGDVNGDGIQDIAMGYPAFGEGEDDYDYIERGAVMLHLSELEGGVIDWPLAATLVAQADYDLAGWAVSTAGDTNADGFDDLWVGAPGVDVSTGDEGAAYLLLGGL